MYIEIALAWISVIRYNTEIGFAWISVIRYSKNHAKQFRYYGNIDIRISIFQPCINIIYFVRICSDSNEYATAGRRYANCMCITGFALSKLYKTNQYTLTITYRAGDFKLVAPLVAVAPDRYRSIAHSPRGRRLRRGRRHRCLQVCWTPPADWELRPTAI